MPLNPTEMAKMAIFVRKWLIFEKMADFWGELRSNERITLGIWFISHFNRNMHFSIRISYNIFL